MLYVIGWYHIVSYGAQNVLLNNIKVLQSVYYFINEIYHSIYSIYSLSHMNLTQTLHHFLINPTRSIQSNSDQIAGMEQSEIPVEMRDMVDVNCFHYYITLKSVKSHWEHVSHVNRIMFIRSKTLIITWRTLVTSTKLNKRTMY